MGPVRSVRWVPFRLEDDYELQDWIALALSLLF